MSLESGSSCATWIRNAYSKPSFTNSTVSSCWPSAVFLAKSGSLITRVQCHRNSSKSNRQNVENTLNIPNRLKNNIYLRQSQSCICYCLHPLSSHSRISFLDRIRQKTPTLIHVLTKSDLVASSSAVPMIVAMMVPVAVAMALGSIFFRSTTEYAVRSIATA